MLPCNPYIAGNPVHGQGQFVGRSDLLHAVQHTLRNPGINAIVLFGQRRIGKTSILLHIEQELRQEQEFMPLYFDLQDKAALPLSQVLFHLAQLIAQATGMTLPDGHRFDATGQFFSNTFISQALEICPNRRLVLLLDEFDVLTMPQHAQAGTTFFPYLCEWIRLNGADTKGIQFVLVLGRRPEELSPDTLSAFKGIPSRAIAFMKPEETEAIIRQSELEPNASLRWNDEAVQRVWYWTQGHPYLTQLLCCETWETAMEAEELDGFGFNEKARAKEVPLVTSEQIDAAIDRALEQGINALEWIWNGLPPAEQFVMAVMAEAENDRIPREELADILNHTKIHLILPELALAPENLIRWGFLRSVDDMNYCMAIPLLRRWVATEKPLRRVKVTLDRLEPSAESLYQNAEDCSKIGKVDEAERLLRNALGVNPSHLRARLLLGKVLLAKGKPEAALEELSVAYELEPHSSKSYVISALMAMAETRSEPQQLALYKKVLEIEPTQPTALKKTSSIQQRQTSEQPQDV